MNYNVLRGLREIATSSHSINKREWAAILQEFGMCCAYCGSAASAANRGIVADHLIPVTEYGELVAGNAVPACQTCNDSRGNQNWRSFIQARFSSEAALRIAKIEAHIRKYNYVPASLEASLSPQELQEYCELLRQWAELLARAKTLRSTVVARKSRVAS